MENRVVKTDAFGILRAAAGPYTPQVRAFVGYLQENGLDMKDGIAAYLGELKGKRRTDREGRKVSYSPAWWNQSDKRIYK
jgi:hypothetical protein